MPYKVETMLMGGDAPNDTSTQLCFNPPNGPFVEGDGNEVTGTIGAGDEDWIVIELSEGKEYTITVSTRHTMDTLDAQGQPGRQQYRRLHGLSVGEGCVAGWFGWRYRGRD